VITHTVHVITKPSEHERFVAAARALRDASVKEDGNIEYSLWAPLEGGPEVLVVERWHDQAAVEAHRASTHMAAFRAAVKGAVAVAPTSTRASDEADNKVHAEHGKG
jgi:quinol monooxygenase YgiN